VRRSLKTEAKHDFFPKQQKRPNCIQATLIAALHNLFNSRDAIKAHHARHVIYDLFKSGKALTLLTAVLVSSPSGFPAI